MAEGEYEVALPVALDAVKQGEALFKPGPALQMFPLYLLAAQANLGLRRVQQCSDALCLAGLLALKEPSLTTSLMRSQLARLNGQLAALQVSAAFGKPVRLVCTSRLPLRQNIQQLAWVQVCHPLSNNRASCKRRSPTLLRTATTAPLSTAPGT